MGLKEELLKFCEYLSNESTNTMVSESELVDNYISENVYIRINDGDLKERFKQVANMSFLPDKADTHEKCIEIFIDGAISGFLFDESFNKIVCTQED